MQEAAIVVDLRYHALVGDELDRVSSPVLDVDVLGLRCLALGKALAAGAALRYESRIEVDSWSRT